MNGPFFVERDITDSGTAVLNTTNLSRTRLGVAFTSREALFQLD
jgi:hypothetical protein